MAKAQNNWKYIGIAAIAYFVFKNLGSSLLNNISFGRPQISLGNATLSNVSISITLPITNNTPVSIPVQSVQADVLYGNNLLSTVYANNSFVVEGNNTTNVNFNAVVDYSQLSVSIANIIGSREFLQALKMKGFANSGGIIFPFENTFSIG